VLKEKFRDTFLHGRVEITVGDIVRLEVDALVNAANSTLLGGGGVDGTIHRAGGAEILRECEELRRTRYPAGLPVGEAVMTTAGRLPAKCVIHTVGPIYGSHQGKEAQLLANCYLNSLNLAADGQLVSVAFPAISTGVYGYPKHEAAPVVSETMKNFFLGDERIEKVWLVFFKEDDAAEFLKHHTFSS
jgi:O-acetyl-ADP-ribose deacetylase (regulator of RNase III)